MIVRLLPVSAGEILDKYSILFIKKEKIKNKNKIKSIQNELDVLEQNFTNIFNENPKVFQVLKAHYNSLEKINRKIWEAETIIRNCEYNKNFDSTFVEAARNVYKLKDMKSDVKNQINMLTNSTIIEEGPYIKETKC